MVRGVDPDFLSVIELTEYAKDLGYTTIEGVYHRKIGNEKEDFRMVWNDQIVLEIIGGLRHGEVIDFYMSHVVDKSIVFEGNVKESAGVGNEDNGTQAKKTRGDEQYLGSSDPDSRSNPGTTCYVKSKELVDGRLQFTHFYVCFSALKQGMLTGCRRVIGLDGAFLKGICKGQLLVAVLKDGNNQMFPVACAVVQIEDKVTWKWFVMQLSEDFGIQSGEGWTFVIDMQRLSYTYFLHLQPSLWTERIIGMGVNIKDASVTIGGLRFKLRGLTLKGKATLTTRQLQRQQVDKRQ
ncbi:hypothetical protein GH714_013701 [Hevea brasiliensis]|uniref:Uncharacterized protein n=1 Tax=Hevea brasiliensis TaxID=3981 RepID=A0A6A6LU02_HEVBR|nr:hypothetical protein GH714_013701 [Hevea brasiliensis]